MKTITSSLCVIGAGPAGIITALEYAKKNPLEKVILIEFGAKDKKGIYKNSLDDAIEFVDDTNLHGPYESTNKGLGGSSLTWGGRCVSYDEIDFVDRPILKGGCTWDLELFEELKEFFPVASDYFESGDSLFNLKNIEKFKDTKIADNFIATDVTDSVIERWSMPTRFGARYRMELENTSNIILLEGYQSEKFEVPDATGTIANLRITSKSESIIIVADTYVISAGAQESTRILLKNEHIFKNLKQTPKALGKYYQGHLSGKIASIKFYGNPKNTDFGFLRDKDGIYLRRRFQFTREYLEKNDLLNTAIWLDNPLYHNPNHKSGAMSFMYLAMITPILRDKLAPPAIAESVTKGVIGQRKKHLMNVLKGLPNSLIKPALIFFKRYCFKRKLPGIFLYSPKNRYALHFHAEQIPLERNQMYLRNDNLVIDYTLADDDIRSVIEVHRKLDTELRKMNCGELIYWYDEEHLYQEIRKMSRDGIHQSGTIRIASDDTQGVVDENLKVFGTSNLFVCSTAVFPTSSQANPTYMLGAFAARLVAYLSNKE